MTIAVLKKILPVLLLVVTILSVSIIIPFNILAEDIKEAQGQGVSPDYRAQWNINYASYLIDVGKYLPALEAYETAFEATNSEVIRGTILMDKASLLSLYLDASTDALKIYDMIIKGYPQKTESALYQKGLLLFDKGYSKDAIMVFQTYLNRYPSGRFRYSASTLYRLARKETITPFIIKEGTKIEEPYVRVLLIRNVDTVELSGREIMINGRPYPDRRLSISAKNREISVGDNLFSETITVKSSGYIKVSAVNENKSVRGEIILSAKDGKLTVINKVAMEQYLRSVVPSESYAKWSIETLKAQAVAARTYAYYQIIHRTEWEYDVVDNEGDQAYKGVSVECAKTNKAVNDTLGIIAINEGRPILAMYTANNGGYMADSAAIFGLNKPYFVSKPDSYSIKGEMAVWNKKIAVYTAETSLRRFGINVFGLIDIETVEKDSSGRVIKVKIAAQSGGGIFRTKPALERALNLPEILFEITKEGDYFIFNGKGWGHGVGYSQWGSAIMGQGDYNFEEILAFYYPETELIKIW